MTLRRESVDDTGGKQEQPSEPLINKPPPVIASPPEQEQVKEKALVPEIELPPPPSSSEDVSAAPLVPEIEEPPPVPEKNKLSTKPPIPPPQKIESKEEKASSDNVKPPPPAPPKVKKPEGPKVETAGVEKPKSTSHTGAFFKIAAAFLFVALLFVGAIYLIAKAFTSDTEETADEAIVQEVSPPAPTSSIDKMPSAISDIQSPYTDPDSDFGEIYMDPNSPFSEPTETKEPSPTITRNTRSSIAKDPSPSQLPSSEKSLTEDTPPPEDTYAPPPVVQKPTPDPAVVDFLNGLFVQGVKSKGDRHTVLMNGNVYNVNSIVSDELAIRLIEVDGGARHLIFKDKNGVRYRKPY
jgi:hypothetical protein